MSYDPNSENSIGGSPFITEVGAEVWELYPRDGETATMKLHFVIVAHPITIILLVCSVALDSSAEVDVSPKVVGDGVLYSAFFWIFCFLKEDQVRPRNGHEGRCVCITLEHRSLFKKQIQGHLLKEL